MRVHTYHVKSCYWIRRTAAVNRSEPTSCTLTYNNRHENCMSVDIDYTHCTDRSEHITQQVTSSGKTVLTF